MAHDGSIAQALEHCLQDLAGTEDIEVSLQGYPRLAEGLRPLLEVAQATRSVYGSVPAAPGGLVEGRQRLLSAAAEQRAQGRAVVRPARRLAARRIKFIFGLRFATVLAALIMGFAAISSGFAWAAGDSLPGDLLYPVKTAVEDARVALTSAPQDQVNLALQLVEERVGEMQALVAAERPVPDGAAVRMERHIERALVQAAWVPDGEMDGVLMRIARRTRTQAQILDLERARAEVTASPQDEVVLQYAANVCWRGVEAAEYGLREPQMFRTHYQQGQGIAIPTVTPGNDPQAGQERHQERNQESDPAPVGTPHATPAATQSGPDPSSTPEGPRAPPGPHNMPEGPEAIPSPQVTPQGPHSQPTPGPQVAPKGPSPTPVSHPPADAPGSPEEPQTPSGAPGAPEEPQTPPDPPDTPGGAEPPREPQATLRRK